MSEIKTDQAVVQWTAHARPPGGTCDVQCRYDHRITIRPATIEFQAHREAGQSVVRWWVSLRGLRVLVSGELGASERQTGYSSTHGAEHIPAWLRPWVDEQLAAFERAVGGA